MSVYFSPNDRGDGVLLPGRAVFWQAIWHDISPALYKLPHPHALLCGMVATRFISARFPCHDLRYIW
jgi:hypothetical protein